MKIDNFNKFCVNESHVDDEVLDKIQKMESYKKLRDDFRKAIYLFTEDLDKKAIEIGYDEGDTDHTMARTAAIQDALDDVNF